MTVSRKTMSAAVKLGVFTAISVLVTSVLVAIMGRFGSGDTVEYTAIFQNASLLRKGDDVRVAGVLMGKVDDVEVYDGDKAEVKFTVAKDLPMTTASQVEIRYLNLVGDRYLTVEQGKPGAPQLKEGATIPMDRTHPALNLTALYNGFAPLFSALEPKDINDLSMNLVKVLQGEGGTVESLMAHTASLTTAVANRDKLVGEVIDNLNQTLGTVDSQHKQLTELIQELRRWVGGLAQDRVEIGQSIVNVSKLTASLADLLTRGRPLVKSDVAELRRLATILNRPDTSAVLKEILHNLPEMLADQTRTGTYGSWYNYYICGVAGNIKLPAALKGTKEFKDLAYNLKQIDFHSTAKRCNL